MNTLTGALCRGQGPLFESTDMRDHLAAKAVCDSGCLAFDACDGMACGLQRGPLDHRPVGTWAGKLYGSKALTREHGTNRGYFQHRKARDGACDECKSAHVRAVVEKKSSQVSAINRTSERVESGAISGPASALTDRGQEPTNKESIHG